MKKILVIFIFLFGGCFSSQPVGKKIPSLTDKDKELFDNMWKRLYFEGNFGYTLLGSKPVSLFNWEKTFFRLWGSSYEIFIEGEVKERWEQFSKEHPSDHYALLFTEFRLFETQDSPEFKFGEIIFINKAQTKACFEKHKDLFTKYIAFTDFSPETIAKEVLDSKNHELIGIPKGFGTCNSQFFQRMYDLTSYFENISYFPHVSSLNEDDVYDLRNASDYFANPIDLPPQDVISELRSRRKVSFVTVSDLTHDNPLSLVSLPCFKVLSEHPETSALLDTYRREQKRVVQFGRSKPFLDAILDVYFNGVPHD